jgi:FAD synthetase
MAVGSEPTFRPEGKYDESLAAVRTALERHTPSELGVSFNGGKDSMVMLRLLLDAAGVAVVRQMRFFVFDHADEFDELRAFRARVCAEHGIALATVVGDMKQGLWAVQKEHGIAGAFIGVRRADPSGKWMTGLVSKTTEGWAPLTLIAPVLQWDYSEVWEFTRGAGVPYCSLYAEGYTSLGSKAQTVPNPALFSAKEQRFLPAWELRDGQLERDNRRTRL